MFCWVKLSSLELRVLVGGACNRVCGFVTVFVGGSFALFARSWWVIVGI